MTEFAILLLTAAIGYGLAKLLRLPSVPILIGAGMLLSLTEWVSGNVSDGGLGVGGGVANLLEFGLIFLVFSSGVELCPSRFKKFSSTVLWVAFVQFSLAMAVGYGCACLAGMEHLSAVYLGGGLAASSTLVVLRHLQSRQAMFEPYGRLVTGVLLYQDIAIVLLIIVLSRIDQGFANLGLGLLSAAVMAVVARLAQAKLVPWLVKKFQPDEENLLLWLIAILLLFVGAAQWLGLPLIAGAFAGGFVFASFPLNGLVRGQVSSLVDFFRAMFFVALGDFLGVPDFGIWGQALLYSFLVIVVTPPLVAAIAQKKGLHAKAGIEAGLLLSQTSEYTVLLGLVGLTLGHLTPEIFSVLALTTVITMTMTPLLGREEVATFLLRLHPFRKRDKLNESPEGHVLMLGFGSAGMWTAKPFLDAGERVIVVEDDAVICKQLSRNNLRFLRGDGADPDVLKTTGAPKAKLIIASMRRVRDALVVIRLVSDQVPVMVKVFEEHERELIENAGGIAVMNSKATADTFMEWLDAHHSTPS